MKKIFKYELPARSHGQFHRIPMPFDAEILTIQVQNERIMMWAIVNPKTEYSNQAYDTQVDYEFRDFIVYLTGENMDLKPTDKYIGTVQIDEGTYVLHIFEKVNIDILPK